MEKIKEEKEKAAQALIAETKAKKKEEKEKAAQALFAETKAKKQEEKVKAAQAESNAKEKAAQPSLLSLIHISYPIRLS